VTEGQYVVYNSMHLTGLWGLTSCALLQYNVHATITIDGEATYTFPAGSPGTLVSVITGELDYVWGLEGQSLNVDNAFFTAVAVSRSPH
jgi:hypothetical protein